MGLADAVIALKEADARAIRRWSRSGQVYLARNGLDISRWHQKLAASKTLRDVLGIPQDAFVVGVLSRLSKEKGIEPFLLAAASSGWLARADAHVIVAGTGPEEKRLKGLVNRQKTLAERAHLLGYQPDMENVYRTLDVLAVPSDTESQPMVVLEAMACRVPAVAFSVGALPEMLADGAGIVVPRGDFDALINALDRLRMSPGERASLVEMAHKRVGDEYNVFSVARDLMLRVYVPLISNGGCGG
jgi:glycosyltransferase involved in cell wall biosynthesis